MSQNSNSTPLDDEDILDLTVIAEPGRGDAPDGPPEPGSAFDADLDALLDSLAADGTAGGSGGASSAPRPAAPPTVAAPIADQTPADHVVDPNEELAMPEMADIDSLLAELGADLPPGQPAAGQPAPAPEVPAASAPIREFESILAQAQAAEAQKAAQEETPADLPGPPDEFVPMAEPGPALPDFDPMEAAVAAAPAPAAPAPKAPPVPDLFENVLAAPGQAPAAASEPETAGADPEDSLDLNELDALLDDILATAPEVVSPSSREPVPAPAAVRNAPPAEAIPVPDQALMNAGDNGLAERVRRMEDALLALEGEDEWHRVRALEETVAKLEAGDDGLAERVRRMEDALLTLEGKDEWYRVQALEETTAKLEARESGLGEAEVASVVEARIVALLEPGSMLMRTIVDEVLVALSGQEGAQLAAFRETLEKMAAAAAAKVIREEIAAIMNDG